MSEHRICTGCVMDRSDPHITFDADGVCNYCRYFRRMLAAHPDFLTGNASALEQTVSSIRTRGEGKQYDCLIGLSGGVDSSYLAHQAVQLGLRPLALHMDNGWDSVTAIRNIRRIVERLGLDLVTYVHDWETFSDVQLAFLRASVTDAEIPTDHSIAAVTYRSALAHGIPTILSGTNWATESIFPRAWTYSVRDARYIRSVHKQYGKKPLRAFPLTTCADLVWYKTFRKLRTVRLLNSMPYHKQEAADLLQRAYGWEPYGGKHHESIYTRFFQGVILPQKFNIDKRRAHLSALINAGQMTRAEALEQLKSPPYAPADMEADKAYVLRRFNLSEEEWQKIWHTPPRPYTDFNTYASPRGIHRIIDSIASRCGIRFPEDISL